MRSTLSRTTRRSPVLRGTALRGSAVAASAVLALSACGGSSESTDAAGGGGGGPITVGQTDTECTVGAAEAKAGTIEFTVSNTGSKVNEFYVYAEGDRIMGEVENITPGLTRKLLVEIADPGEYETACKPGMVGDGIRAAFTVTGESKAPSSDDELLTEATASYARYVGSQADALLIKTTEFVNAVKAGKVEEAKALYPVSRQYWERIEPVAESFGDLDPKIDGREDVIEEGMQFTGYHRIEKDLWQDGLQPDTNEIADRLLADVTTIVAEAKTVELNPLQLANGSKGLLDEIATGKITGEEDRYSHTDLYDFNANFEGSKAAIATLRPYLTENDADLVVEIDATMDKLDALLESHRDGDGFVLYTALTEADVKALTVALDAVTTEVTKVAAVVAQQ